MDPTWCSHSHWVLFLWRGLELLPCPRLSAGELGQHQRAGQCWGLSIPCALSPSNAAITQESCSDTQTPTLLQAKKLYWLQGNHCLQESKAFERGGKDLRGLWGFPSTFIVHGKALGSRTCFVSIGLLVWSCLVIMFVTKLLFLGFVTWRFLSLSYQVTSCCTS